MELKCSLKGKPVRVAFDERRRVLQADGRMRIYFSETINDRSPALVVRDGQLRWRSHAFDLDESQLADTKVAALVEAVNALRSASVSANVGPAGSSPVRVETDKHRAARIASNVETFAWVLFLTGIAGGVWVALQTQAVCTGQFSCEDRRPFIGLGVGIAVASAFQTAVVVMVAVYIQARVSDE